MATAVGHLLSETPRKGQREIVNGDREDNVQEQLFASSPMIPQDPYTPPNRSRPTQLPSALSSARISRELESLRAHLPSRLSEQVATDEPEEKAAVHDGRGDGGVPEQARRDLQQDDDLPLDESEEPKSFSALSKRADKILNDAKKRLGLLETNIKGARHSFSELPTTSLYTPLDSRSPTKLRYSKTVSSPGDEFGRLSGSPRINFGAPRSSVQSTPITAARSSARHARNYSETSVPSPYGTIAKGSAEPLQKDLDTLSPLRSSLGEPRQDLSLAPVLEEASTTNQQPLGVDRVTSSRRSSQLLELRSEAEVVRDRLSAVQERVRTAVERRRSWQSSTTPLVRPSEVAVIKEVEALRQSLRQQESAIGLLEEAANPNLTNGQLRHAEWEGLTSRNLFKDQYDRGLRDGDDYSDEDGDYRSVPEEPELEEIEADLDRPHEDRLDAFDYEHFIIHSVFNNANARAGRSPSVSSSRSATTERAIDTEYPEEAGYDEDENIGRMHDPNQSVTSFETARSFVNMSDSDSEPDEDESELDRHLLPDDVHQAWPMPPRTHSREASTVFENSEPATPPNERTEPRDAKNGAHKGQMSGRPASMIFAALTDPTKTVSGLRGLSEEDETLMRSLAEAMRFACVQLQRNGSEAESAIYWRSKLEEARRLLSGESDMM